MRVCDNVAALVCGAIVTTAIACSNSSAPIPSFADTTGEADKVPEYAPAPYGPNVGSIVENYQFLGFKAPELSTSAVKPIQLADFYNPHGKDASYAPAAGEQDDRYFPADSGYPNAGKLKPTVLLIDVASVWCGPCNDEAATVLPGEHAKYDPCGGEFLLNLADSETPGIPAGPADLTLWDRKYAVNYPGFIDPEYKLSAIFQEGAYPENIIIDTTTMKLVYVQAGEAITAQCGGTGLECVTDDDCPTACQDAGYATYCASGDNCPATGDCPTTTCQPTEFWSTFETLLDKTRTGCTLQ